MKITLTHAPVLTLAILILLFGMFMPVRADASYSPLTAHTLVSLTNKARVANGLNTVVEDMRLDAAAQKKANDMASNGYFAHVSPNGTSPWSWILSVGYRYTRAGENLAVDFTDALSVEQAWMRSPSHRANMVKSSYTAVGVGIARGFYNGRQTTFVVQFFATPVARNQLSPLAASLTTQSGT